MSEPRFIKLEPDPVKVVSVPRCRYCRQRAPWCVCGLGPLGGYQ